MKIQRKRIISLLLLLALSFVISLTLVGCRKVTKQEYITVEATITDSYHRSRSVVPMRVNKVTTFITHPEKNEIMVTYNDNEYTIDDRDTYEIYNDQIGAKVICNALVTYYDDDTSDLTIDSIIGLAE